MAFYFTQRDDLGALTADAVMRSILRQCIETSKLTDEEVSQLIYMLDGRFIGINDWNHLIRQKSKDFTTTYIIVDGLDEFSSSERQILVKAFASLFSQCRCLKFFLAGRPSVRRDLEGQFNSIQTISMLSEGQARDIQLYVEATIQLHIDLGELVVQDTALYEKIILTLSQHADGM